MDDYSEDAIIGPETACFARKWGEALVSKKIMFPANNLHSGWGMKTKFGCIVLPCGCLVPLFVIALALLASAGVVLAKALF